MGTSESQTGRRVASYSTAILAVMTLVAAAPVPAQSPDTLQTTPGPHYAAGSLARTFLGSGYRDMWTHPIRVEVLDLGRFAGGLTPLRRGGGNQTRTLHLEGEDGRRYIFRSVDKFVEQVLPPDLRRTFVHDLFQDHISALHPSGALAVPPLLDAVGVLHVEPRLVVMPDDPRLGEHREEFAGMLGQIEERPNEGPDDTPGFAGSARVVGMERLLERLDEDRDQVLAAEEYLAARLVDFLIGDTDRGSDQWRWAGEDRPGGGLRFRPIPRDRDWAFLRSEGLLSPVARLVFPKLVRYGPSLPSVEALTYASVHRDRQFLAGVPRQVWDSVVAEVRAAITPDVITAAVARLPPEHRALGGERIAGALAARRDALPRAAEEFYAVLAEAVDVRATDEDDQVTVDIRRDGTVEVRVGHPSSSGPPWFRRRFHPSDTREIRVILLGGDDRALVRGAGSTPIAVRVIGGAGDDTLVDSTTADAGLVAFYDARGSNTLVRGPDTRVDLRPFDPPEDGRGWIAEKVTRARFRDWGGARSIRPDLAYGEGAGLILGARVVRTRYGFRRAPHAHRVWAGARYAVASGGWGVRAGAHVMRESSPWGASVEAVGEQFDAFRFYGFGNEAAVPAAGHDAALVMQDRAEVSAALIREPDPQRRLALGLRARYLDPRPAAAGPLGAGDAAGGAALRTAGAWGEWEVGRVRGGESSPSGYDLSTRATLDPGILEAGDPFGTVGAEARAYLTGGPTLALRAGGRGAWGAFPVQDAAFIGGKATVRGYRYQRFAGDGAVYGSAELRSRLTRALLLVRGNLGAFAFVDAGRVFLDGRSPGGWHTGLGAGLSFTTLESTLSASWARGEEDRVYLDLGWSF
ncbi:MAG: outer membrane protein assembly factor [Gemmatimonadetes bacterium]|nr:outer membrane protein assembly factor [Gemmatimonadota bacterium]